MNIFTQCCGVVVMLVILYFYRSHRKVQLNIDKGFWRIYIVALFNLTFDILSIVFIKHGETVPDFVITLTCRSYLVTFPLLTFLCNSYVSSEMHDSGYKCLVDKIVVRTLLVLGILAATFMPIHVYSNEQYEVYTYGPAVLSTYILTLMLIACMVFSTLKHKDKINVKRRNVIFAWSLLWMCGALIQFVNNEILLMGFLCSIGVLIVFIRLENPELNIDKRTGLYTNEVFVKVIKHFYNEHKEFSVMTLNCINELKNKTEQDKLNAIICEMSEFLSNKEWAMAFVNQDDVIYIVIDNKDRADEYLKYISARFQSGWGTSKDVFAKLNGIFIKNSNYIDTADNLLYIVESAYNSPKRGLENISSEYIEDLFKEKKVEQIILDAIRYNKVEVFYQPIYSTVEQKFVAAEALVRIRDDEDKIMYPGSFIEVAEKTGFILGLGSRVFQKVCEFIKDNDISKYGLDYIEVNLSMIQCSYEHLADNFIEIMKQYDINPKHINLEITETATVNEKQILLNNMKKLMDFGVSFSLDDFGTGQSNLNYIVEMPVQIVKFDKSMIDSYFANGKAKYVMNAAMNMIHGMKLPIVAEGIETAEQLDTMRQLKIEYIQGYYFSKPVPGNEFINFIVKNQQSG